jgi:indole-3-glycerol phosphate synthase/phosphoribosylanthranilate isomerase
MNFLERAVVRKGEEVARLLDRHRLRPPERPADAGVRDFAAAIRGGGRIIAEVKHRSPSYSDFRQQAAPARLALAYARNGAAALSVVTDAKHFGTSLADVRPMREATGLPVLVKDFVIDTVQVREAWAAGADALLLIARILDERRLRALLAEVESLGMTALVECHDEDDVAKALACGARVVGVNNRDLSSLATDLGLSRRLAPRIPDGVIRVSESGLSLREHITELAPLGVDAFLIGHALLRSRDPGRKLRELRGVEPEAPPRIKVCGLTTPDDAALCHEAGAGYLGVILADSPRRVTLERAREIRDAAPEARLCGVFVDADPDVVVEAADACGLDLVQLHGDESPAECRDLAVRTALPVIKVLRPGTGVDAALAGYGETSYLMYDLPKGRAHEAADGERLLAAVAGAGAAGREVFLAGGLSPANVRAAMRRARPFAVDVCRGVEREPGHKDPDAVRRFVAEVAS